MPSKRSEFVDSRINELTQKLQEKDDKYRQIYKELRKMKQIQEQNVLLSSELERLHTEYDKERKEHEETVESLRLSALEKETSMKEEMKARLKEFRTTALDNAKKQLSKLSKELINENADMKESLIRSQRKLREMSEENQRLQEKITQMRRNSALHTEEGEIYAQKNVRNNIIVCVI